MATPIGKEQQKIIQQAAKARHALQEQKVREIRRALTDLRGKLRASLLAYPQWDMAHMAELRAVSATILTRWQAQWAKAMAGWEDDAWAAGQGVIDAQLQALGLGFVSLGEIGYLERQMMASYAADLISGVTDYARGRIINQLNIAIMGTQTPIVAMRNIERDLGWSRNRLTRVSYRAERIVRTEMGRSYCAAAYLRQQQAFAYDPELERMWVAWLDDRVRATHLAAHGQRVKMGEPFKVGGFSLRYPGDPAGPPQEVINCR